MTKLKRDEKEALKKGFFPWLIFNWYLIFVIILFGVILGFILVFIAYKLQLSKLEKENTGKKQNK